MDATERMIEAARRGGLAGPGLPSPDPWRHRSTGMRCASCMWFVTKLVTDRSTGSDRGALGRCRRHAPTLGGYPAVFEADWCGDHKLDEAKV